MDGDHRTTSDLARADDMPSEIVRARAPRADALGTEVVPTDDDTAEPEALDRTLVSSSAALPAPEVSTAAGVQRWNAMLNRGLVSAYKVVGFVLLAVILIGIAGFVGVHSFYLVHRAWVAPRVLSASDPEVIELRSRLAQEAQRREALVRQRLDDAAQLKQLRLMVAAERAFQQALPGAIARDAAARRESAAALQAAQSAQQQAGQEMMQLGKQVQYSSLEQLKKDFDAKLIDRQQFLQQSYQLGQLAQTGPRWLEQQAQLSAQIRQLSHEAEEYEAAGGVHSGAQLDAQVGYDGALMQRDLARSAADEVAAEARISALEQSQTALEQSIVQSNEISDLLENDPLIRASEHRADLAFVPYSGRSAVREGSALYECRVVLFFCRKVGAVGRYLPGERTEDHPVYGKELRGQWVEIDLDDPAAAAATVLHTNRPPLLF